MNLGLKFARTFAHQAKLASLHAYCRDRSNGTIQAASRTAPFVHTELRAMDAAVAQVEQWLRHPSEFISRLAGLDSAWAAANQHHGDPSGRTASRTALDAEPTSAAREGDFESFLSASMNPSSESDASDASGASVVDTAIVPPAGSGVTPPIVYSAALRRQQRSLSDPESIRSIVDARKQDAFAFVNKLGAVLTSAKENDFRRRGQATTVALVGGGGGGGGDGATVTDSVARPPPIPAQSLLAAMSVTDDQLDVLSLVSLKVRLMLLAVRMQGMRIGLKRASSCHSSVGFVCFYFHLRT